MPETPAAYCFFQNISPRPPMALSFQRDYLLHALRGGLDIMAGEQRWILPPSFAAWVPANGAFEVHVKVPVTSCSVLATPGFAKGFPAEAVAFQMSPLAREMVQHCRHWGEQDPHPDHAETFFSALFSVCADLVGMSADVSRPASTDPQITKALAYSDAHLAQSIEASEVAHASGLSERTLQRRFSEQFGETCSQTLNRMRMIRAIELLCDPDRKVLTIAGDCGFQSLCAFNRSFRAYTGVSPSAFRKNLDA